MAESKPEAASVATSPTTLASPMSPGAFAQQSARSPLTAHATATSTPIIPFPALSATASLDLDARLALSRTHSHLRSQQSPSGVDAGSAAAAAAAAMTRDHGHGQAPGLAHGQAYEHGHGHGHGQGQNQSQNESDRTDALWAEMQATLAEVELSAARGAHFFGPDHASALEELRGAQIALAQAWARSESDDARSPSDASSSAANAAAATSAATATTTTTAAAAADGAATATNADSGSTGGKSPSSSIAVEPGDKAGSVASATLGRSDRPAEAKGETGEQDAERDMVAARKRREANDRYFYRVSQGVMDVVGRLEEVADAMRKVEKESREIWSDGESMVSGTTRTSA